MDRSDLDYEICDVWYDINECTNSGYNTLVVEPGLVASVHNVNGGAYRVIENYNSQFCNVVIQGMWHNTFTNYSFPLNVVIDI